MTNEITDVVIKTETPKRKRRTKAEMAAENNQPVQDTVETLPVVASVELADLLPPEVHANPLDGVKAALKVAGLMQHVAELHANPDPDGSIRRVEMLAKPDTSFLVSGLGDVKWATFTGDIKDFPVFLQKITPQVTFNA